MSCRQCKKKEIQRCKSPLVRRHHDLSHIHDPMAKRSQKIERTIRLDRKVSAGDGDIWVEKICQSSKTGKLTNFFESTNTGKKVMQEPPTGASSVIFLKNDFVQRLQRANKRNEFVLG